MPIRSVLLVGLDPRVAGTDAQVIATANEIGRQRFTAAAIETDTCLVEPDAIVARPRLIAALSRAAYSCVVVGGGLRKADEMVELFEVVVNLVHRHAPQAAIAFTTNPMTSLDAVLRCVPELRAS
jgi:hypothetical protein